VGRKTKRKHFLNSSCVHCGVLVSRTRDHCPPKCLFRKSDHRRLIEVPSCSECNNGASDDDEYFKVALFLCEGVDEHPVAAELMPGLLRAFQMPQKQGFVRSITDTIRFADVVTPTGLYTGVAPTVQIAQDRLRRALERYTRGLFYHEFRRRLPTGYSVMPFIGTDYKIAYGKGGSGLRNLIAWASTAPSVSVGSGVFQYRHRSLAEEPNTTAWMFEFFGKVETFVLTLPNDMGSFPPSGLSYKEYDLVGIPCS
jgi:hypothetical protein